MKTFFPKLIPQLIIIFLFINSCPVFAEDLKELKIDGGILYSSWTESTETLPCVLNLETPAKGSGKRLPIQIILLIDASRKMVGDAHQNVKLSAQYLLKSLLDTDMLGIVMYSAYTRVIAPLQPLNANNRRNLTNAINRIKYENGRNLSDGLKGAAEQFSRFKGQKAGGHYLILFTCGNADNGVVDQKQLLVQVKSIAQKYTCGFSTFGYGLDYEEDFLIACANSTGGRAYFIEPDQGAKLSTAFKNEVTRLTEISIQDVMIEIFIPRGVTIEKLHGGIRTDEKIQLGNLKAVTKYPLYFEFANRPSRRKELSINIEYTEPASINVRRARYYIDIPIGSGIPEYDKNYTPQLIELQLTQELAETIEYIEGDDKQMRIQYSINFGKKIKELEQLNVTIGSTYLKEYITRCKELEHDFENGAIESDLLIKKIKYQFANLFMGIPVSAN